MSFTDKGIAGIKDTTKRAVAAREAAKKFGVNFQKSCGRWASTTLSSRAGGGSEQALAAQSKPRRCRQRAITLPRSADEMDKILAKLPST
jgi:hypothetical protein